MDFCFRKGECRFVAGHKSSVALFSAVTVELALAPSTVFLPLALVIGTRQGTCGFWERAYVRAYVLLLVSLKDDLRLPSTGFGGASLARYF